MESKKTTKCDLVETVYKNANNKYERKEIQDVAELFLEAIKHSLSDGDTIEIRGFGTFKPVLRRGRVNARNPRTGKHIESVAPHYVAAFRPGQDLKESMMNIEVVEE